MTWRLVVGLAVLVLVTGCGGDDTAQEKREDEEAVRAVVAAARAADGTPAALRAAADALRDLDPPDEVAGPHRDLVAELDAIAAADARGAEPPDEIVDRILAARRAFAARRYDIGVYGPLSGS